MSAQLITIEEAPAQTGAIERVLLVDDSRLQRRVLSASLERAGYDVAEASSGAEALALCAKVAPDLVLSAWAMPEMDGLEFCQKFRAQQGEHYAYFILLTSKSEKDEVIRGLELGADDFLVKPINAQELQARISAGERIVRMQRELLEKNRVIGETLSELQRVHDNLDRDLIEAKRLQESLVPNRLVAYESCLISLFLQSSGHVGGDLVGHFPIDETKAGIFSIDVSGHGVSSALMTARLAGYLSPSAPEQNIALRRLLDGTVMALPPAEVIGQLNDLFLEEIETEHYFTMMLGEVDLLRGTVTIAQAGHPHPLIQRACGAIEQSGPGGLPVGLVPGARYDQFEIQLYPGDRLLILSDGVTECQNFAGKMLEEDGLAHIAKTLSGRRGQDYFEGLIWHLQEYAGARRFDDDISGVLLEFDGT